MNIGLLDSENIQSLTSVMLKELDRLIICINQDDEKIRVTLPVFIKPISVQFVRCLGKGKNNLDHHIMSLVGYIAFKPNIGKIRILSNDTDYQNVISFWRSKGANIEQLGNQPSKRSSPVFELSSVL